MLLDVLRTAYRWYGLNKAPFEILGLSLAVLGTLFAMLSIKDGQKLTRDLRTVFDHLTTRDEVKFVIGSREDYEWTRDKVQRFDLPSRCHAVLFSPIFGRIDPREIVEWILADKLEVRFQLQMHKFIWSPTQRGV